MKPNNKYNNTSTTVENKKSVAPLVFYLVLLVLFIGTIWGLAIWVEPIISDTSTTSTTNYSAFSAFRESVSHHASSTVGMLLMQIVVILIVSRAMGWLFAKIKQPTVIGEIVSGIVLGPSLLGAISPDLFQLLFPPESLAALELLSVFGLILFMFTIGMELNLGDIKAQFRNAFIISQASTIIPFILGMGLAVTLYQTLAPHVPFIPMTLFMGISMSITAFPVLARIIQERGMNRTDMGKLALNTAASADIFAWLLLAAIMAVSQSGSYVSSLFNFLFLLLYLLLVFGIVRPIFKLIGKMYNKEELVSKALVGFIFILLLASAYVTELLSIHALFGAFMTGLVMPEDLKFRHVLTEKVEDVSLSIFLPLFFVASGLKTNLTLINSWYMVGLTILFVAVAVVGKVGGTYAAARVCQIPRKESLYLGAYMNTRGLMELVVLKIGLDLGFLTPLLFAILVMMTVLTTIMTAPMVMGIDKVLALMKRKEEKRGLITTCCERILIAFGRKETGNALLHLSKQIFSATELEKGISLLHTTYNSNISVIDEQQYYTDNFQPILASAKEMQLSVDPIYKVTDEVSKTIVEVANDGKHKFLLVGAGLQLSNVSSDKEVLNYLQKLKSRWHTHHVASYESLLRAGSLFNDKMNVFTQQATCHVGIFVPRPFKAPKNIYIAVAQYEECNLASLATNMATYNGGEAKLLTLLLHKEPQHLHIRLKKERAEASNHRLPLLPQVYQDSTLPIVNMKNNNTWPDDCDFLFISYNTWLLITEAAPHLMENLPPTFIVRMASDKDPHYAPAGTVSFE